MAEILNRKSRIFIGLLVIMLAAVLLPAEAEDAFRLDFDYNSRSFVESARRDWNAYVYNIATATPVFEKRQYDKSFLGTTSDMYFALKSDLSETHYLDIKENIYYRHYNENEFTARDYSSFRYGELDHLLNVTWGIAAGDHDYFQLDYFNNILDLPDLDTLNFSANRGRAQLTHEFGERTCFSLAGAFEEREYDVDTDLSFREGRAGFEIASRLPGHHRYVPVAASARGEREYFVNFPGAMSARKAVEYYTDFATNPRDDDPRARYMRERRRGELFLRAFGDFISREYTTVDNEASEISTGFETAYDAAADLTLRLRDTWQKTDFDRERPSLFHHDRQSNYLALALDYYYSANMAQTLTLSDEMQKFSESADENFRINALTYEGFFVYGRSSASLNMSALRRRYDEPRRFYPDEDEWRVILGYDYLFTDSFRFRMKSEFINRDYLEFEDYLYSTYTRNAWRIGIEKAFSSSNSVELAYQEDNERNELHTQNNVEEKTVGLSWISHY